MSLSQLYSFIDKDSRIYKSVIHLWDLCLYTHIYLYLYIDIRHVYIMFISIYTQHVYML